MEYHDDCGCPEGTQKVHHLPGCYAVEHKDEKTGAEGDVE